MNVPIVVAAAEAVVQKEVSRGLLSAPLIVSRRQRRKRREDTLLRGESVSVRRCTEHLRFVQGRDDRRRREAAHRGQAGRRRSVLMRHMTREREGERTRWRAVAKLGGLRGHHSEGAVPEGG